MTMQPREDAKEGRVDGQNHRTIFEKSRPRMIPWPMARSVAKQKSRRRAMMRRGRHSVNKACTDKSKADNGESLQHGL